MSPRGEERKPITATELERHKERFMSGHPEVWLQAPPRSLTELLPPFANYGVFIHEGNIGVPERVEWSDKLRAWVRTTTTAAPNHEVNMGIKKNESIAIRVVANGFIVTPAMERSGNPEDIHVFPTHKELNAFLAKHFKLAKNDE